MEIRLENVSLGFGDDAALLAGVNLTIAAGDFVIVRGPSGSGKSSFLRLLDRLVEPRSGTVWIDGQAVEGAATPALRRRLPLVQQTPMMVEGTVRDNLHYPFRFAVAAGATAPDDEALRGWLARFLLDDVDLGDDAGHLSVGQQQRLSVIRVLLTAPEALLCDEPTSALDDASRRIVEDELERVNRERGMTVVMVTHQPYDCREVTPRRFELRRGDGLREVR